MERGELGTDTQRRVIFIWEGALAHLPDQPGPKTLEAVYRKTGRYDRAVGFWEVHEHGLAVMWTLFQRTPLRIDLAVTTRESGFARAVADLSDHENWPVRYVFAVAAAVLGRRLPQMPDVERVFYGVADQRFAYGPHGFFLDVHAGQIV